ncbi:MAG: aspartate aminotransferase family protein [Thermoanaerobaculia bacterium]
MTDRTSRTPSELAALFLGPKGENADLLERLLTEAFRDHVFWRRNFHPEDGFEIAELDKRAPAYDRSVSILTQELYGLLAELKGGVPFFSPRYVGHMTSDLTMASLVGYFATMLYNPNNVALEGSPVTTRLELEVAAQLAAMVGFPAERTWGHLTAGGTIANFEAFWVARNVKYLPVALAGAADELGLVDLTVVDEDGRETAVAELDLWRLLNIHPRAALDLADRLLAAAPDRSLASAAVARHSVARVGYQEYGRRLAIEFGDPLPPAAVLVPSTAHYSWQKVVRALGIGADQLVHVPVDARFRMDTAALWSTLERLASSRTPVLAVVAVLGTTEESAVDRVDEILAVRRRAERELGLAFPLHVDGAWGGYAVAVTREPDGSRRPYARALAADPDGAWPSREVYDALVAVEECDSITIDPHKFGYVPYPAGAVLFRDRRVRELVATDAPYVFQAESPESVSAIGPYILEGSKPGAAAAAVWLSHRVLPLDAEGHGTLIGATARGALALHRRLATADFSPFRIVLLPEPDLNIVCFAVAHPALATLEASNALIARVHGRMSVVAGRAGKDVGYFVTKTILRSEEYGDVVVPLARELGHSVDDYRRAGGIAVLRSTVMNPFFTEKRGRTDHLEGFLAALRSELAAALAEETP